MLSKCAVFVLQFAQLCLCIAKFTRKGFKFEDVCLDTAQASKPPKSCSNAVDKLLLDRALRCQFQHQSLLHGIEGLWILAFDHNIPRKESVAHSILAGNRLPSLCFRPSALEGVAPIRLDLLLGRHISPHFNQCVIYRLLYNLYYRNPDSFKRVKAVALKN